MLAGRPPREPTTHCKRLQSPSAGPFNRSKPMTLVDASSLAEPRAARVEAAGGRTSQAMGAIREVSSGRLRLLEPENLIGRAPACALRLAPRYVSATHAMLRWRGTRWDLKDLGSRNGTYLQGTRLRPGQDYALSCGAKFAFGKPADELWELTDESAPAVMVVPLGGDPVVLSMDLIVLPSIDDPEATIYRTGDGQWVLEQPDEPLTHVRNAQVFQFGGRTWRFCCPESVAPTALASMPSIAEVKNLKLNFFVTRDEEFVQIEGAFGDRRFPLGSRAFNFLLLTLARRRLADAREGLPEASCGWIHQDELDHDPSMAPPQLNLDIHRIRRLFASVQVIDAGAIIERRSGLRQLRLGTGLISIVTI
jgi:hypothetical protein